MSTVIGILMALGILWMACTILIVLCAIRLGSENDE